jgi:hypothetical protein
LKELEVLNKQQELDAKKQESEQKSHWSSRWNNPVVLAVLAALVGYLGTLITWSLARKDEQTRHGQTVDLEKQKQKAMEQLEKTKLQGTLILDAMKTGEGPEKAKRAAANLLLLADAKLVTFDRETTKTLKERAGDVGPGLPSPASHPELLDEKAYSKIREDVAYAVSVLNELFEKRFPPPSVEPSEFARSAYFDPGTTTVHAPPALQYIPDLAYRVVAHRYRTRWEDEGESGALGSSVADVLASVVKQRRLKQTAKTADWVLYRVAWLREDDLARSNDSTPWRSLKAPGTAYDDSALGKDPQVDHMSKYVKTPERGLGAYINSGIPSRAFYEAALKLGTDKAAAVWVKAISKTTRRRPTFAEFARETASQAEALHGADARKAVLNAWKIVGVEPAK